MNNNKLVPNYIFEASWEVCNKVGGIYTVLSSRAKTLLTKFKDNLIFIGPDLREAGGNADFTEDGSLYPEWQAALNKSGIFATFGRWNVPGNPVAILVDFKPFFKNKDKIYTKAWADYKVDSLRAYGDYDEASMFSYAAGSVVAEVANRCLAKDSSVVFQAHEWMSGLGMLHVKSSAPQVATIFTTHATSIGRSIAGNNKELYKYFEGYNGDQMASELHMEAKHSIEKVSAWNADCFTTVSTFTDRECKQLLQKSADVVTPNGFENDFVPKAAAYNKKRKEARAMVLRVAECLTGKKLPEDSLIISTSGRNDFRCKGFDVYMQALANLRTSLPEGKHVVALIEVPCWVKEARQDLSDRLKTQESYEVALPAPYITHDLYNFNEDRIVCMMRQLGLSNNGEAVTVILVPCYLEGKDGIWNMPYYDLLLANDLSIYPSYYEPWGYTPLESCAFKIPCITTDLSGFGQWVDDVVGHKSELADGVAVLHRDDDDYFEVANQITSMISDLSELSAADKLQMRKKAKAIADKALWKHFINYYYEAYDFALRKAEERMSNK